MASKDIWASLLHFTPAEFGPDADRVEDKLLRMLDRARSLAGVPFEITSAWRPMPPDQPQEHARGYGCDVRAHDSVTRMAVVAAALDAGFRRIGVAPLHVHLGADPDSPPDVMWIDHDQ